MANRTTRRHLTPNNAIVPSLGKPGLFFVQNIPMDGPPMPRIAPWRVRIRKPVGVYGVGRSAFLGRLYGWLHASKITIITITSLHHHHHAICPVLNPSVFHTGKMLLSVNVCQFIFFLTRHNRPSLSRNMILHGASQVVVMMKGAGGGDDNLVDNG